MLRRWLSAVPLCLLIAFLPAALANHPQAAHGDVVVFDHRTGNEWWVEVVLSGGASGSVAKVEAMDEGGPWTAMASHPEWAPGDWAASFHIEPGHLVRFRASWSGGDMVESCWFTHPAGVEQCPTGTTTTSTTGTATTTSSSSTTGGTLFDATFSNVKGNEWWVEATVTANQPIAKVEARVDCAGAWHLLPKQDWGSYAASFNVPSGHTVDFRATSTGGATDLSTGYSWPAATPVGACGQPQPPPGFKATFSGVQGNEWWIQASSVTAAGGTLSTVDTRLFDGAAWSTWKPLTRQSWGGWAASYHAPSGTLVQLRATSTAGDTSASGCYRWTAATAVTCPVVWPEEGTFVQYRFDHTVDDHRTAETTRYESSWSNLTATYHDGDWHGACTEHKVVWQYPGGPVVSDTTTSNTNVWIVVVDPLAPVGGAVRLFVPHGCSDARTIDAQREADWFSAVATPSGVSTVAVRDYVEQDGTLPRYFTDVKADRAQNIVLSWDTKHVEYECECYSDHDEGRVVATSIPVGPVVTRPEQKAAEGPWPVDGTRFGYTAQTQGTDGWRQQTSLDVTYSASTGTWTGSCRIDNYSPPGGYDRYVSTTTESVTLPAVPAGPGNAATGSMATLQLPRRCSLAPVDAKVGGPTTADFFGPPNGGGAEWHTIEVLAGQGTATPTQGTAHWDPETGILMDWDWRLADGTHVWGQQVNLDQGLR